MKRRLSPYSFKDAKNFFIGFGLLADVGRSYEKDITRHLYKKVQKVRNNSIDCSTLEKAWLATGESITVAHDQFQKDYEYDRQKRKSDSIRKHKSRISTIF